MSVLLTLGTLVYVLWGSVYSFDYMISQQKKSLLQNIAFLFCLPIFIFNVAFLYVTMLIMRATKQL
ncbi:MAG: hypothetical protein ACRCXZ_01345 [Patescibacteria group bacterium]